MARERNRSLSFYWKITLPALLHCTFMLLPGLASAQIAATVQLPVPTPITEQMQTQLHPSAPANVPSYQQLYTDNDSYYQPVAPAPAQQQSNNQWAQQQPTYTQPPVQQQRYSDDDSYYQPYQAPLARQAPAGAPVYPAPAPQAPQQGNSTQPYADNDTSYRAGNGGSYDPIYDY